MYSVKNLVENGYNFSIVFPEKQDTVRKSTGLDFNLSDIVSFLKKQTNNFTIENTIAKDLDEAIVNVVKQYEKEFVVEPEAPTPPSPIEKFKQNLYKAKENLYDDETDDGKKEFIDKYTNRLDALEILAEDDEPSKEKYNILKEFIESLKN
jgi:hypothetical protein